MDKLIDLISAVSDVLDSYLTCDENHRTGKFEPPTAFVVVHRESLDRLHLAVKNLRKE